MVTATATERIAEASPRFKARMAGLFYLLTFLTGGVAAFIGGKTVVAGDAAATAALILAHESLFRLGTSVYVLNVVFYIAVTWLFFDLFEPVSRSVSRLAAYFSLIGCAVQASACLFQLAPLVILGGGPFLSVFETDQLQALALLSLKLHAQAFDLGLVFFAVYCVLIGYLVLRSTFLPRILGLLMVIGGLGWLTFLYPPLATALSPYILAPGILGEGALTLWLLAAGVNAQRWREQASLSARL